MSLTSRMIVGVGVLVLIPSLGLLGDEAKPKASSQLMSGEKVLPVDEGPLLNPIRRFESHPWFEVSNLRPGRTLRDALELDFAYEGVMSGSIHIVVLTNGKRLRFPVSPQALTKRQGTIACSYDGLDDKSPLGADLEVYVELTDAAPVTGHSYSPSRYRSSQPPTKPDDALYFKVSKSAVRGKIEALTYARELRENEQRIYDVRLKKYGPPPPPPEGSVLIPVESTLVPGVPILAALEGDWLKAEVLTVQGTGVSVAYLVHWPQFGHTGNRMMTSRTHLAIQKEVLAKLEKDPKSFSPSAEIPYGALQPPPPDYVILPAKLKMLPGTPVSWGGSWNYLVVRDGTEQITVLNDRHSIQEENLPRRQLIIHKDVLKQLTEPDAEKKFAAKLKELQTVVKANRPTLSPPFPPANFPTKTYPIDIEIPEDYVRVTKDTPLEVEARCMASWGRRWNLVTVKRLRENGDPEVQWDGWSSIDALSRDSLVIAKSTLEELTAKAAKSGKTTSGKSSKSETKSAEKTPPKKTADKKASGSADKFKLILESAGKKKISVVKVIMEITDLDLASAKEVADDLPIDLKSNLSKEDAERWKKKLEGAGGKAKLEAIKGELEDVKEDLKDID